MKRYKRIFVIVLDSLGIGAMPDSPEYGDVGVLLARAVKNNAALKTITTYPAAETIRATVVGAGTHTTNVSGSTISYTSGKLPIKNIPVLKISEEEEQEPWKARGCVCACWTTWR